MAREMAVVVAILLCILLQGTSVIKLKICVRCIIYGLKCSLKFLLEFLGITTL